MAICEVEVIGHAITASSINYLAGAIASQSYTYAGGEAKNAVDGGKGGKCNWSNPSSVTHNNFEVNPWWKA